MRFFLLLCCLLSNFVWAAQPSKIEASYDVFKESLQVAVVDDVFIRNSDGTYQLTSTVRPVGIVAVFKPEKIFIRSAGRITPHGLQPLTFDYERENAPARSSRAEFAWERAEVALIRQGARNVVALLDGTQDRLSELYQFMFVKLPVNTTLDFSLTNGNSLSQRSYAVATGEQLTTAAGKFDTLYLDNASKSGESRTEIWLSTQPYHLLCKMRVTESNGDQIVQTLSKVVIQP
jgi:hypothetical protein